MNEKAEWTRPAPAAPQVDAPAEEAHWRAHFEREPYHQSGRRYEDDHVAYELGWSRRAQSDADFDVHESDLAREWEARRGPSPLGWPEARSASRAAWDRADRIYYEQARAVGQAEAFAFIEPQGDAATPVHSGSPEGPLSNDEVVGVLNHLLENARDGEHGYHVCSEEIDTQELTDVLLERADQYQEMGRELLPLIARHGGTPADGGTVRGALQRGWVHVKGAFGGDGAASMLAECERAEDASIARYRHALEQALPADVREVIDRQSAATREYHARVQELRHLLAPDED